MKISILDLAMVTEGGSAAQTFENSADLAKHAEKWGYKRYWLAEHHNMEGIASSATSVLIGYIASQTKTIRVGSGGVMLPNHSPLVIAEQFGTLETLHPGRIDLGLGRAPGTDQLTAMALIRDPRAPMEFPKNVMALQRYLSAQNRNSPVRAFPGEGLDIPIWILGSSTDSAYLAASLGLPYAFASHFAPAQLMQAIDIYRSNFKPSKTLDKPFVLTCINVIAADNDEDARILSSSFKKLFLGIITGDRRKLAAPDPDFYLERHEEAALETMTQYSFAGSKSTVESSLKDFITATQTDELMISTPVFDHHARLHSYEILSEIDI